MAVSEVRTHPMEGVRTLNASPPPVSDTMARLTVRDVPEPGERGDLVRGISPRRFGGRRSPQCSADVVRGRRRDHGGCAAGGGSRLSAPPVTGAGGSASPSLTVLIWKRETRNFSLAPLRVVRIESGGACVCVFGPRVGSCPAGGLWHVCRGPRLARRKTQVWRGRVGVASTARPCEG